GLLERLRRETSLARTGLGFAPSLIVEVRGESVVHESPLIDEIVDPQLADDVVAVVREGLANAARHAQAASVHITVIIGGEDDSDRADNSVIVRVIDDGVEIPTEREGRKSTRLNSNHVSL